MCALDRRFAPGQQPRGDQLCAAGVFTPSNTLTLEIGGRTAGAEHDKLTFTHAATPPVQWGGTLVVELTNGFTPVAGDVFDVFNFAAGGAAGTFNSITGHDHGLLPAGLTFNFDEL